MRRVGFSIMSFVSVLLVASAGVALPSPLHVKPGRITPPIQAGSLAGGKAGAEFSLLEVKKEVAEGEAERLVIYYGDQQGRPVKTEPGYFHVTIDREGRRVVIDLAQVSRTAVQPAHLARVLLGSKLVASSEMSMDPHDHSTNITLQMKVPVAIRVASDGGSSGRLGLELHPIRARVSRGGGR